MHVTLSKSGMPTLALGERFLHSAYDPVKEARREVEPLIAGRPALVVILGMGLGYAIDAVRELLPDAKILVVEADEALYNLAKKTRALPEADQITYVVGRHADANFEALSWSVDPISAVSTRYLTRLAELHPDYYSHVVETIGRIAAMHIEGLKSTAHFGKLWWENSVRNYQEWATRPDVSSWFGPAIGGSQPCFIFAAGPTLGDHLDLFAAHEGGIRFVVDTAYETVHRAGVRIDAVFAIDAQTQTLAHFARSRPARLVASPVVPPALWNLVPDALLTSLDGPHFAWWDHVLTRPVARLKSGGSVTTFAFDLSRRMNAEAIILVGADFAHRSGKRHVGGTAYEVENVEMVNRFSPLEKLARRPIFQHGGYETEPVLTQYAQWMLWEIHETRSPVYRMVEFGLLNGVPIASKDQLDRWLGASPPLLPMPHRRLADVKPVLSALARERASLAPVLGGDVTKLETLSGFWDLITRPYAVATAHDGLTGAVFDALRDVLRQSDDVLDDVLAAG